MAPGRAPPAPDRRPDPRRERAESRGRARCPPRIGSSRSAGRRRRPGDAGRRASRSSSRRAFQRVGLVRYNPFEDTGGNQSFALALLDADEDGLIISSLHARSGDTDLRQGPSTAGRHRGGPVGRGVGGTRPGSGGDGGPARPSADHPASDRPRRSVTAELSRRSAMLGPWPSQHYRRHPSRRSERRASRRRRGMRGRSGATSPAASNRSRSGATSRSRAPRPEAAGRPRGPARRPQPGAAPGRHPRRRTAARRRRRRDGQDPGHHPADRLADRHPPGAAVGDPRPDVHGQGRRRDAGPGRPARAVRLHRRDDLHVPRLRRSADPRVRPRARPAARRPRPVPAGGRDLPARAPVRVRARRVPAARRSDPLPRRAGDLFSRCKDEDISPARYLAYAERLVGEAERLPAAAGGGPATSPRPSGRGRGRGGRAASSSLPGPTPATRSSSAQAGFIDFGDQVSLALRLAARVTGRPAASSSDRFRYILVDEFQDTNRAQSELVALLAEGHRNVTVVGDDDQSIYRFRGAAISNILEFRERYRRSRLVVLRRNYRSRAPILDASHRLIRYNDPDRLEVRAGISKRLRPERPSRSARRRRSATRRSPPAPTRPTGSPPRSAAGSRPAPGRATTPSSSGRMPGRTRSCAA